MSNSSGNTWSNNPYAPNITHRLYLAEKRNFAGFLIGAICYGIVIVLFFECIGALFNPINRTRGNIRWGLAAHTTAMFSLVTVYTAMNLYLQSISYIDNRDFPGTDAMPLPGPFGYQIFICANALNVVPSIVFALNTWLADGLLFYRCCVTYAMNYWIVAFPCLMYLASVATGIGFIYQMSQPTTCYEPTGDSFQFGTPYYSISLALNVFLTFMIVARLALHRRTIQRALGSPATAGGLYRAVVNMLIESCALYAASYVLFIGPWAAGSSISNIFFPILAEAQVIAPFLIVLRVANQRSLTGDAIVPRNVSSLHFGSKWKSSGGHDTLPRGSSMDSTDVDEKTPGVLGIGTESSVDPRQDMV